MTTNDLTTEAQPAVAAIKQDWPERDWGQDDVEYDDEMAKKPEATTEAAAPAPAKAKKVRTVELLLEDGKYAAVPAAEALGTTHVNGVNVVPLTDAQAVAIKQGWRLPQGKIGDLREQLAAVEVAQVPSIDALGQEFGTPEAAEAEYKRLTRNANTNAWRERTRLQAAIDTRGAKFALLRAHKGTKAVAE